MSVTQVLQRAADDSRSSSISHRLRARRFNAFARAVAELSREQPVRILDVGGTVGFWERRGWAGRDDVEITLLNLHAQESGYENIEVVVGDATALPWDDDSFDIAFSNSVIEHLFTHGNQERMAAEMARVAPAYWVQTPNFWFPVEPHYLVPGWQWLPEGTRASILQRRGVGWAGRTPDRDAALHVIRETRLLRRGELAGLFPGAKIVPERIGGLVKSWTAVHGLAI